MNRNEKRRWSRILAMILVFAMVFCDPSMSYAAEVVGEMLTAEAPVTENVTKEDQAAAEAEAAQAAAESEAARLAAESEAAAKAAAESEAAAKAAAESEAAAKAAAESEAAAKAAAESEAAAKAAAESEAAARAAAESEAAAKAAAESEAAAKAAAESEAAAKAAAESEAAAKAAAESEAAAKAAAESEAAAKAAAESEAAAKAAAESEAAAKAGTLVLKTEPVSTQNKGEAAKLKVTYSLSADSGMESVETRLYVPGQTISYPQFTANGETRFVDPVTGRVFDLKRDENWNLYIEYTLHRGETFEEEFQFVDSSVTAGSQNTFEVSITTRGTIPANSSVQTTTARVTYAVWAEETEAPVETETAAETETETETETVSEAESETETAVETESETETETAAATESETETETESETEIVTETETAQVETENAGIFDYEDDKAQISVEILNFTPENQGLRFAVNSIGEESKTFEKIAEQIIEGGSTALVDMLAYYIGVVDETGKAPAENELIYQITMKFKTPVLSISDYLSEEDKDSTEGEVKVYVEGTEIPADIQKNKKGAITGISFITDKVGNTAVALTSGLQTTADITMKTESNEYFMKLEDAKQTNLKVDMSVVKGEARNDVQNAKASAKLTYYDADGNEVEGITPAELQGFGVGQGSYLGNSLNNINGSDREKVVYVKIFMEAGELADTSFKFGEDDPSYDQGSRTLTFKLAKRTFEPDEEITTKKGITYIAVGPNHQYGLTGPLGLVSNFHAIGFSKVTNGAHTNGNILTKKLNYKNNFGTNGLTGEISYIRSFESIAAGMMCGDGSDDILVLGKDIDVTWAGNTFYLNGQKLTRPMTIYQDTEEYQYLDIDTAKEEAESLSSQFGALPDAGVTFENKTFKVSNSYSGMTVINVGHDMLGTEALAIEGLHNQSGTSLLINVKVPKGTEEITIPNVSINGTSSGSGEVIDFSAGKVIWNVVYEDGTLYTGKVSNGGAVAGTILVPDGKVHAAHNWNGSLIADEIEITGETHRTDFTGVLGFGVSKVLKGRDWKLSDRFQFELSAKEGTPMPIGSKTREGVQKKIISVTYSNRSPSFGGITYGTADIGKTYQYTLKELEGNIKDIIYSEAVYTIQVSIQSNNGQGLLIIKKYSKNGGKTWEDKMPEEDVFEFTNVSGVEFKVKKKYNSTYPGKNDDNVFKFVLKGLNEAPMPQKDENAPKEPNDQKTIIVTSSEEVSFDSITYKEDGTYKYEISEVKGKLNGVTYDEKVYDVKVEVSKDENGTGVIKVSSREKGAEDAEYKLLEKGTVFTAEFTNTYDDASAEIKVQKNYNGTYPEGDNAFKFILKALNGAPLPKIEEEEEPSEAAVQSTQDTQREVVVTNGEPVSFGTIEYSTKGTYYYEVSEVIESLPGVTYDETVYEVKVDVTGKEDGTKTVKVSYRKQSKEGELERDYQALESGTAFTASFTNRYEEAGSAEIRVKKNYNGTYPSGKDAFKFILTAKTEKAPLPSKTEVTVGDGNEVSFGKIKYDKEGTYEYEVREVKGEVTGVTYDEAVYEVRVVVTGKEDGTKDVVVSYRKQSKEGEPERDYQALESGTAFTASFTNRYEEAGSAEIQVQKDYNRTYPSGANAFKFTLTAKTEKAPLPSETEVSVSNEKAVSFGTIQYDTEGTYEYEVREVKGNEQGVTYDETVYEVKVAVTGNEDGTKDVVVSYRKQSKEGEPERDYQALESGTAFTASFTNRYEEAGSAEIQVQKDYNRTYPSGANAFKFTLTAKTEKAPLPSETEVSVSNEKAVSFGTIQYDTEGTYEYEVREVKGNEQGVTYDETVYEVKVAVTGNEDGTKDVVVSYRKQSKEGEPERDYQALESGTAFTASFTNRYEEAGSAEIQVQKDYNRTYPSGANAFKFTLTAKTEKAPLPSETEVSVSNEKAVSFGTIQYDTEGTYEYEVREVKGNEQGVTYDETVYEVKVAVTGNEDGTKDVVVSYRKQSKEGEPERDYQVLESGTAFTASFTNRYEEAGSAEIQVQKDYNRTYPSGANAFKFTLTAKTEKAPLPSETEVSVSNEKAVSFGTIQYDTEGTYEYEVREVKGNEQGVTYDETVYEVKVAVTGNEDGTKDVVVSYRKQSKEGEPERDYQALESGTAFTASFTNRYEEAGSAEIQVQKDYNRTYPSGANAFKFTLTAKTEKAPLPSETEVSVSNEKAVSFGTIQYDTEGTYEYEVREVKGNEQGVTYDETVYEVKVAVTGNEDGTKDVVVSYRKQSKEGEPERDYQVLESGTAFTASFTNRYEEAGSAEIQVQKDYNRTYPSGANAFKFTLTAKTEKAPLPSETEVSVSNEKAVSFGTIQYDTEGTYEYEVREVKGNEQGVTYDETVYEVKVAVTGNEDGTKDVVVSYRKQSKEGEPERDYQALESGTAFTASFTNRYEEAGSAEIQVQKDYNRTYPSGANAFKFTLTAKTEKAPLPSETEVSVSNEKAVSFGTIQYDTEGTYEYEVREVKGNEQGVTYDETVYEVKVAVTGNEDGTKDVVVSYRKQSKEGEPEQDYQALESGTVFTTEFTNTYKPAKTTAVFTAEKKVEGPTIADDTFTFELYKDKVEGTPLDTKTITGNGTVDFAEQTYEATGTYTYKIVEKAGSTPGYTYDASIYTVIVDVTDIGGKLESKVTYVKDLEKAAEGEEVMPSENALFTNTYKPAETTAVFTAEKKVEGLTPADSTFTFELYKNSVEAANLLDTQNITGAGITTFAEQTYDAAGIYTYKIVEKAGEEAGYTYDTSVYTVTVEVTDIGGKLVSKVAYAKDGADNAAGEVLATAVFTNTYNAGDTKAVFTAKKTIKGDPQKTSRFTFELYKDSILEANLLDTKSIRGEGTVDFTEQTYDVPGTYTYKIVEKAGETAGYSYDGSIYTVTVEVTDIGGKLTNTVTYAKDDAAAGAAAPTTAEFINTYDAGKTNAVLTATKTIKGTPAKDSKFTFELYKDSVAEENLLDTKSITGTGSVNFKEQNYKAVGTYTYKIVEKAGEEAGYIYDTSVYTATVVVTDKGGELARKITYTKDGAEESKAPASAVFENTYDAGSTEAVFEVTKAVNGTPKKAGTFTFELYKDSVKEANLLDTQTIKGQGRAEFAAQTYKEPGTYTYKIIEKAGNEEGYTYDNSVYTVTVTVTDEGGRLDNTVAYENENGARRVYQAAEFVNEYKEKLGRIVVTKQVVNQTLDGEVPYLVTDTFYFALFKDEALTEMSDYGIKTLKLKNQSEGKVVFEDVDFGEYYLAETDKDGNPVTAPPFIEYFVTIEDPLCEVTKAESTVKKIVKNAKLPDNYGDFGDGEMIIDKYVLNGSEEYTVTDTFYFTLFRDEELKIPYEQFETKKLDLNDEAHGTVTFEKLPYGVYYLAETDADGKPVGDGFDYEVKIEKKQFTISETNKKETIRIDNCITPDTPGGKHTPKTGDDTLIWPYVTMMLAALVAGTGSIFGKRRRKRSSK